jgi:hypothetical protein
LTSGAEAQRATLELARAPASGHILHQGGGGAPRELFVGNQIEITSHPRVDPQPVRTTGRDDLETDGVVTVEYLLVIDELVIVGPALVVVGVHHRRVAAGEACTVRSAGGLQYHRAAAFVALRRHA